MALVLEENTTCDLETAVPIIDGLAIGKLNSKFLTASKYLGKLARDGLLPH